MADWYGSARSNYFRVKNKEKFEELCSLWNIEPISKTSEKDNTPIEHVGFVCENQFGGLPNYRCDPSKENEDERIEYEFDDFLKDLSKYLEDNEVAVMIEVGAEKLRYITGVAYAINSKGEQKVINLGEIYERAEAIGKNITVAEY